MKKIFIPFLLLFSVALHAQLNNSWIDYSKTYYKFKLGATGLCRIKQPVLAAAGLSFTPAEQFQLFRNGQEVPLFTSVATGELGTNDYIEFIGRANDGAPDKNLYLDPAYQLCDSFSMFTDTATYFLTVNTTGTPLRYTNAVNNTAGNTLPADNYFMRRVEQPYKDHINRGFAEVIGEPVYSASYDQGEGWTSSAIGTCAGCPLVKEFDNLNLYTGGPVNTFSFKIQAFGDELNQRNIRVRLFNNVILDTAMSFYYGVNTTLNNLPLSLLQSPDFVPVSTGIDYNNISTVNEDTIDDEIVVAYMSLTYPAKFNFNGQKNFYFELGPSSNGNYLVINNFNSGSGSPVLYDINNNKRYIGDISTPGSVKFALPGSVDDVRKFTLVSEDPANLTAIGTLSSKTFIDYSVSGNQGDYIIISNPDLYNDGKGVNNVEGYRAYRASAQGGGFNAKTVSIDELTDQFGFGIKKHPAAIRDFIMSAQSWPVKPKYVFIIGRALNTLDYQQNETNPQTQATADMLDQVQTFGWPASDILLSCSPGTNVPLVPIGRLPVINGGEIANYLEKMKDYEQVQASTSQTIADKAWMKNLIHVAGGADSIETATFVGLLNGYAAIASDTLFGGVASTFAKSSTAYVEQASGGQIQQLINGGVSIISYFGHSAANTLEYNLSDPEDYQNAHKYPFFNVSGCSAGDFYGYDPARSSGTLSISEKWVLAQQSGSIGFLADTHLGIPPYLDIYNTELYNQFSRKMYGNSIGNQIQKVLQDLKSNNNTDLSDGADYYLRVHMEELNLDGDPALKINSFALPDYDVESSSIKINPSIISVADSSFTVNVSILNIGKAIKDSMRVIVKRQLPNNTIQILYNKEIPAVLYQDTLNFVVHINPTTDAGDNKLTVVVDELNEIAELSETNDSVTKDFIIYQDDLNPVYPYNYSIVNQQTITYSASTANPLGGQRQYLMEIDTTALFNSAFKKQYTANGVGGVIQFVPTNISYVDSTVYYWRVSVVPLTSATPTIWNTFSFVYLPNSTSGFNQSHYYQHLNSTYNNIELDADRIFRFSKIKHNLIIKTGLYPYANYDRIGINLDFDQLDYYGCKYNSLQVVVYDSSTFMPMANFNTNNQGQYGSYPVCQASLGLPYVRNFFEYPYADSSYRKALINFLDSIPNGKYVSITNLGVATDVTPGVPANTSFISDWQADSTYLGSGNTLYNKLKKLGFSDIDSFTQNIAFVFFYQKGVPSFTPQQFIDPEIITANIPLLGTGTSGTITSPLFGPAAVWRSLHWNGKDIDPGPGDSVQIQVYGVKADGVTQDLLATVVPSKDTSLSFIDPVKYPFVKLSMLNTDTVYTTPNQLSYWRINADYVPEGAVAPNILYSMKDSFNQGDKIAFALAFKNVSPVAFDSLQFQFVITNNTSNQSTIIPIPKGKALVSGDTLVIRDTIDTKNFPGNNTLYVMVNPNNDQPEQFLFNNSLYQNFYVNVDKYNPLLDVTFDGIHILDKDLVSSKPHITIKLTDENKFLSLNDTSLIKVQVYFPDPTGGNGSLITYHFGDSMQFVPADLSTGKNVATINLTGNFPVDGQYQLIVSGKDAEGNPTGDMEYRVAFNVINKTMISNLFNYPNPFTTSTAFVFTLTGSQLPQNMRIQILTITGKVVKEITQSELGPLHVGDNITQYKWDGTDTYGQKLANGVYLYRVITNLNGKSIEKYNGTNANGDVISDGLNNTNQFFTRGYGKMYLMR